MLVGVQRGGHDAADHAVVRRAASSGGRLIVVDPRRDGHRRAGRPAPAATPGTDLALANGLLHIAIRDGLIDEEYIAARTSGFDAVTPPSPATGPTASSGSPASRWPTSRSAVATAGRREVGDDPHRPRAEQHSKGVDTVHAFINLALALGQPGKPTSGYGCLTGQGNGQGGREHGQKADQLPGYRLIEDAADRAHVAEVWGVDPTSCRGRAQSAYEMLDALGTPAASAPCS